MRRVVYLFLFFSFPFILACDEEFEPVSQDLEFGFQPLKLGNYWIYEVEETIHFGENDFETTDFFYRDRIRSTYLNDARELVYIVERSKSTNRQTWVKQLDFTLQIKNNSLLRTVDNRTVVALVFPPSLGLKWNGMAFQAQGNDEFEIESVNSSSSGLMDIVRVNQQDLDDKVTIRDVRFEVFQKEVGLIEKYDEVISYCSRNNCLGQQLIDGGSKVRMKLIEYEIR
jgi:hypothetical protein